MKYQSFVVGPGARAGTQPGPGTRIPGPGRDPWAHGPMDPWAHGARGPWGAAHGEPMGPKSCGPGPGPGSLQLLGPMGPWSMVPSTKYQVLSTKGNQ